MRWNRLIGQDRVRSVVGGAFESGTLGHAYLFCGERGTGKFAVAVDLAMAHLCSSRDGARPCGECPSCKKVLTYSHMDFHVMMPLVLQAEHRKDGKLNEEGWAFAAKSARERIEDPYKLPRYDAIPNIPVDWIREVDTAIRRGGVEGASNVAIIDGIDAMKDESGNAMLKTLEEPPPGTLMILLTDKIHKVLPTIVSRCQIVRFGALPPDVIKAALCDRFDVDRDDPSVLAAASCESVGRAIEEFEDSNGESYELAAELWGECVKGDFGAAAACAERVSASGETSRQVIRSLLQLLRAAILRKSGATDNYINMGMSCSVEFPAGGRMPPLRMAEEAVKSCQEALRALDYRGNAALVTANLVCTLMEILLKQQSHIVPAPSADCTRA